MDVYLTGIESQIPHPLMIFSAYFRYSLWPSCDPDTKSRKKNFRNLDGGSDGTRTRGLQRDSPLFKGNPG